MKVPSNKIADIFRHYLQVLEGIYELSEAKSFLYLLLDHFFTITRLDLAKNPDARLSESELLKIHFAVKELMNHKPIQHIIGSSSFCGFEFCVNSEVLIPRPETEELVERIIQDVDDANVSILDIGTGSGCIAISVSKKLPNSMIHAIDVSEDALIIAKKNAKLNGAAVNFLQMDILSNKETACLPKFDIIVSNPPYVRESEKTLMQKNVLDYDPELALFVSDEDPFIFYRVITELGKNHLNQNGKIYFEINEAFGCEISKLLEDRNYSDIKIHKDFRSKDRFISAVLS